MRGKKTINFTASIEEIERFRRNVKRANEIQKRYTERQARITGKPVEDIAPLFFKRSANLSQFSNRKEFLDALNESEKLSRKGYMRHIQEIQKENYINAIETVFGEAGEELADKIRRISARTFADMQAKGLIPNIGFLYYDPASPDQKLEEISEDLAGKPLRKPSERKPPERWINEPLNKK